MMNKMRYIVSQIKDDSIKEKEYTEEELVLLNKEAMANNMAIDTYAKVKTRLDLIQKEKEGFKSEYTNEGLVDIYEFAVNNYKYLDGHKSYLIINPNGNHYKFSPEN